MSINVPEKHWWAVPLDKDERTWVTVALIWCLLITVIMPWWHITGNQNTSKEYYRISADAFDRLTDEFIDQHQVGEEAGFPVVAPPANSDVFLRATQFAWEPVLKLKLNQTYRFHLSSLDVNHGFSVLPINFNFQVVPGWDHVLTITPTTSGEFFIVCNEFCGIGHHTMIGKIYVES
jgi:cytochrome c oxidase subunit 2